MKLKLLVAAMAVAATPFAAQADLKISGDITAFYQDSIEQLSTAGSEVNLDATNGNYFAHAEVDFNNPGDDANVQELRIGMKMGNGELILGEVDNACDAFDVGVPDLILSAGTGGGCSGSDRNSVRYVGKSGAVEYAVSHNPLEEESAVGARMSFGNAKVNIGYVDGVGDGAGEYSALHAGGQATFGAVTLGVETNTPDLDGDAGDTQYGVYGTYKANGNTIWAGVDDNSDITVSYARDLGNSTTFFAEADMLDEVAAGADDTDFAIGLIHKF